MHLLETCRLRQKTAAGPARAEADWWERHVLEGIERLEGLPASADSEAKVIRLAGTRKKP